MTENSLDGQKFFPLKNKAQVWTFMVLEEALERFPFLIKGLDYDNDSAFINYHLLRWSKEKGIYFTRSHPYQKNDNCHVEQRNWSVGRRYFGYYCYDTESGLELMKKLSQLLSFYVNYFQPMMKLIGKRREGAKVKKFYDEPKTPYERILQRKDVSEEIKRRLMKS